MIVLGVDPGVSGAVAFFYPGIGRVSVHDVPVAGGEISAPHLATLIRTHAPSLAVIERVSAMPGQGVSSCFNFGRSYGDVRGVIGALNIPLHYVTPSTWKKYFKLSSDKELSRKLAIQRFPAVADHFARKKDDGRAEAALIALYGAEVLMKVAA
jgi:crossover junction endodeoxyribonuclease RuvC